MEDVYPSKNHGPDSGIGSDNGDKRLSTTEVHPYRKTHISTFMHTAHIQKYVRTHTHTQYSHINRQKKSHTYTLIKDICNHTHTQSHY